jgi:ADP-heptose:LPS heptosyltransferase
MLAREMAGPDAMRKRIAVGLASGLGNCVFMLPAIKALHQLGHDIALYVDTDFPTADLWQRCAYATTVYDKSADLDGREAIAGEYCPASWKTVKIFLRTALQQPRNCVWKSNMRLAHAYGYQEQAPDVSDWCRDLKRNYRWDVGIIPGSKGNTWLRKRWDRMNHVAAEFISKGMTVAVFGLDGDGKEKICGEQVESAGRLAEIPELLSGCRVIISTDSGVGHLAASLGIPVVMIFTATSAVKAQPVNRRHELISPDGLACHPCVSSPQWYACRVWKCHERIDPTKVVAAAGRLFTHTEQAH